MRPHTRRLSFFYSIVRCPDASGRPFPFLRAARKLFFVSPFANIFAHHQILAFDTLLAPSPPALLFSCRLVCGARLAFFWG